LSQRRKHLQIYSRSMLSPETHESRRGSARYEVTVGEVHASRTRIPDRSYPADQSPFMLRLGSIAKGAIISWPAPSPPFLCTEEMSFVTNLDSPSGSTIPLRRGRPGEQLRWQIEQAVFAAACRNQQPLLGSRSSLSTFVNSRSNAVDYVSRASAEIRVPAAA
jgi:hypothetical protein